MIPLTRIRTPQAVHIKYRGVSKTEQDKELMLAQRNYLNNPTIKISFNSAFWKSAKTSLKKDSFGKCAYCEANTEVVAHGDVEHYRPKSIYWWLAYTFDNYLYACQICNQIYKSDNFPIGAVIIPEPTIKADTTDAEIEQLRGNISPDPLDIDHNYKLQYFIDHHRAEKAFLLNPYFDDPAVFFAYVADDITEEVKIIPTLPEYETYVKAAEEFYGINRIELQNFRYQVFRQFRIYKHSLKDTISPDLRIEVENQIQLMKSDKYLFAGMCRYFDGKI